MNNTKNKKEIVRLGVDCERGHRDMFASAAASKSTTVTNVALNTWVLINLISAAEKDLKTTYTKFLEGDDNEPNRKETKRKRK